MKLKTFMMSAAISALIAGSAVAQTATTDSTADGTVAGTADMDAAGTAALTPQFTSISEMTVGDLVGQNVYQPNGDTIGDVDYVVGRDGGALAVIGIGGFLGLGEYTVALPLNDFNYDASQQMVTLDTTKDALKEQAEFDESDVESLPDETPLADLISSADPVESPAITDDAGTLDSPALEDDASASDGTADADMSTGDAEMDDDAATPDASAESDMTTDEGAAEEETVTNE